MTPTRNGTRDWRWFVRAGDIVFDVGANTGAKAELFLRRGAKVVCVEPQPDCVAALRAKFKRNRRVAIVPQGVADKPGELELSICSAANTISTFSSEWKTGRFAADYQWDKVIRMPVTTLDDLFRKHGVPAYCKIDVEGFELPVLRGLKRPAPLLSFEFVREFPDSMRACIKYLTEIGYRRFNLTLGEEPAFLAPDWLDEPELLDRIAQITDPVMWGDIYAQHGDNVAGQLPGPDSQAGPELALALKALRLSKWFKKRRADPEPTPSLETIHNFNQNDRDAWVASRAATVPAKSLVLDIGAGTCPYRKLFAHCDYRTHDFKKYEGVKLGNTHDYGKIDYVSDITAIPLPDGSADFILCTEVLEHLPEPIAALREMARLVKPGGRLFLTAPLGSGLHQLPYHFYGGFTPEWYRHFAEKFGLTVVKISPNGGYFKLLAQECSRFSWTFEEHRHCHGENGPPLRELFGEVLPRYLFALESQHRNEQFTVGYHVELAKPPRP